MPLREGGGVNAGKVIDRTNPQAEAGLPSQQAGAALGIQNPQSESIVITNT